MMHKRDMEQMLAAISEEEMLEAQLEEAQKKGADGAEARRLGGLINKAIQREVEAEGEADQ